MLSGEEKDGVVTELNLDVTHSDNEMSGNESDESTTSRLSPFIFPLSYQ